MASTTENSSDLPFGVGRLSTGWLVLVAILGAVALFGLYSWAGQIIHGKVVTGARDIGQAGGAAWGLYIVMMLFALGVGFVGIAVVAITHVFKFHQFHRVSRIAEVLSLAAIVVGLLSIMADLGQPFRAVGSLLQFARPQSPFYGTMLLALTYLVGVLVFIYLDGRRDAALLARRPSRLAWLYRAWASGYQDTAAARGRHARVAFWLGVTMLALLLLYHTTLGLVFALLESRPVWSTGLLPVWHFALNIISGLGGALILVAAALRLVLGERAQLNMELFRALANILLVSIAALALVVYIEVMSGYYSGNPVLVGVLRENMFGTYAGLSGAAFLMMVTAFVLLGWQFLRGHKLSLIVVSAALVLVGAFLARYVVVISSQTHGNFLPYGTGVYTPSSTELAVVAGFIALGALFYLVFMKVFPIIEVAEDVDEHEASVAGAASPGNPLRMTVVLALVAFGLLIQAIAYFRLGASWAFPPDSVAHSNPNVPFAPVVYLSGVIMVFAAAVVYELWPDSASAEEEAALRQAGNAEPQRVDAQAAHEHEAT